MSNLNLPPWPRSPRPYVEPALFLRDGRPAEKCERCGGTGNVEHGRAPWMDYPCPERCEDGLVPMRGQAAVVALIVAAIDEQDMMERRGQLRAAKELIENMSVSGKGEEPEPWR